jgi:hypothetical protein
LLCLRSDASFLRCIVVAADPGVDAAVDEQLELPRIEHVHNVGVEAGCRIVAIGHDGALTLPRVVADAEP